MNNDSMAKKAVGQIAVMVVILSVCLFIPAGTIQWWNGWAFLILNVVIVMIFAVASLKGSPELAEERMTAAAKAKPWDKAFVPLLMLFVPVLTCALAGLDKRLGWSDSVSTNAVMLAIAISLLGNALTFRAMQTNKFFSSYVRIQKERGHSVVDSGPYRYVRHPGYTGGIIHYAAAPVILGSLAAFWATAAYIAIIVTRTALEDKTLRTELEGYQAYSEKVRYRLIPFIW